LDGERLTGAVVSWCGGIRDGDDRKARLDGLVG
jgi:hypothetical protein